MYTKSNSSNRTGEVSPIPTDLPVLGLEHLPAENQMEHSLESRSSHMSALTKRGCLVWVHSYFNQKLLSGAEKFLLMKIYLTLVHSCEKLQFKQISI